MDNDSQNDQNNNQQNGRQDDRQNNQDNKGNGRDGGGDAQSQLQRLKNRALDALLPVVEKTDQPAERKFEILMTAARSSGDPALLAKTLDAAQNISSDNQKADAILDVLNEINYNLRES